jgi:hypothetical protein
MENVVLDFSGFPGNNPLRVKYYFIDMKNLIYCCKLVNFFYDSYERTIILIGSFSEYMK